MPRRALYEKRPWLLGSLAAALAYHFLHDEAVGGLYLLGMKGAAAGMLGIYALLRHRGPDGRLLALIMALAAAGDMAEELDTRISILLFFAVHLAAIMLFLRNRRAHPSSSQKAAAAAILLLTPLIAYLSARGHDGAGPMTIYAVALGGMGAGAWASRFTRYRVGAGAVLFIASDLLVIGQFTWPSGQELASLLAWPLHYVGLFLICTGVIQTLRKELPSD